jgi:hypothetical protein
MTDQTCDVVSIELETKPWEPEGKGRWVVTVDHDEKSEFELPENPSQSQAEAELAEKLADLKDSDADLVAEVSAHTSPMTPDTTHSLDTVREVEGDDEQDDTEDDNPDVATDGGEDIEGAEQRTTSQQDDVAGALERNRGDDRLPWTIETDTIADGRPAVRVSWCPGAEFTALSLDSEQLPHGWEIVQFGTRVDGEDKRYLTLAPPDIDDTEPALYDALARELTASELRDYLAVERFGYLQTEWANESELNRSNVSERVNSARRKLDG